MRTVELAPGLALASSSIRSLFLPQMLVCVSGAVLGAGSLAGKESKMGPERRTDFQMISLYPYVNSNLFPFLSIVNRFL